MVACADYPHDRGTLWDCPGCEKACACTMDYGPCVHCARQRSNEDNEPFEGDGYDPYEHINR